jgi:hypothetical protein
MGVDVKIHIFLTSAPAALPPGKEPSVDLRAGLDDLEKRKFLI